MIDLIEQLYPIERTLAGSDSLVATNKVKIMVDDTEILNEKVPKDKQWRVYITLKIEESKS